QGCRDHRREPLQLWTVRRDSYLRAVSADGGRRKRGKQPIKSFDRSSAHERHGATGQLDQTAQNLAQVWWHDHGIWCRRNVEKRAVNVEEERRAFDVYRFGRGKRILLTASFRAHLHHLVLEFLPDPAVPSFWSPFWNNHASGSVPGRSCFRAESP